MSPLVIAVAGSDSSGGAGLQADLLTIASSGCRASTVVTAVTAQGSQGVLAWEPVSPDLVRAQLVAALDELHPAAIKTGMLATSEIVGVVADALRPGRLPVVCDPVAAATSGHSLLGEGGLEALRRELLPVATLVTPNASEAELLSGLPVRSLEDAEDAAKSILEAGPDAVLVTGGHLEGRATDVLVTREGTRRFAGEPIPGADVHGTGCVLSTAAACGLAEGLDVTKAVERARETVRHWILGGGAHGKTARRAR